MFSQIRTTMAARSRRWVAVAGVGFCVALGTVGTVDAAGAYVKASGECVDQYSGEMFWSCAATATTNVTAAGTPLAATIHVTALVGGRPCPATTTSVQFTIQYQDTSGGFTAVGSVPYVPAADYCETDYAAATAPMTITSSQGAYLSLTEVCGFDLFGTGNLTPPTLLEPIALRVDSGTGCVLSNR